MSAVVGGVPLLVETVEATIAGADGFWQFGLVFLHGIQAKANDFSRGMKPPLLKQTSQIARPQSQRLQYNKPTFTR